MCSRSASCSTKWRRARCHFAGTSSGIIFDAILNRAPVPPVRLNPDVPGELERIIDKCLEKDRNLRYQHASDIRTDLQRLKRDTDSGRVTSSRRSQPPPTSPNAGRSSFLRPRLCWRSSVAGYVYFHRRPSLTDKDTIVLADFTNTTGDPVFDGTLRQGLAIQLEQSPFLSLVSEERIQKTLALMGQPTDARLTPELAREICERTASAAVLEGSIASLGTQYVVGLRARHCRTGNVLARNPTTYWVPRLSIEPSRTAALAVRSQISRASSGVSRASAGRLIRPSVFWIRSSETRLRKGDCSSCIANPWRSVPSNTGSPVVFVKSARTIVSLSVSWGRR